MEITSHLYKKTLKVFTILAILLIDDSKVDAELAFNVEVSSQEALLEDEKILLYIIRDITKRKFIEENLSESLKFNQDITDQKEYEENLIYFSYHDQLTGLYNRRYFEEEIIKMDREENYSLSIIMIDINGLKLINDSFGHSVGDDVLIKTAKTIKDCCRPEDISARLGGMNLLFYLPEQI